MGRKPGLPADRKLIRTADTEAFSVERGGGVQRFVSLREPAGAYLCCDLLTGERRSGVCLGPGVGHHPAYHSAVAGGLVPRPQADGKTIGRGSSGYLA